VHGRAGGPASGRLTARGLEPLTRSRWAVRAGVWRRGGWNRSRAAAGPRGRASDGAGMEPLTRSHRAVRAGVWRRGDGTAHAQPPGPAGGCL